MSYNCADPWRWEEDRQLARANYRTWSAENAPKYYARLEKSATRAVNRAFAKTDAVGGLSYLTRKQYAKYLDPLLAACSPPLTWARLIHLAGVPRHWERVSLSLEPVLASRKRQRHLAQIMWTHEKLLDKRLLDWNNPLAHRTSKTAKQAKRAVIDRLCRANFQDVLWAAHHREATTHLAKQLTNSGCAISLGEAFDTWSMSGIGKLERRATLFTGSLLLSATNCVAGDFLIWPSTPSYSNDPIVVSRLGLTGGKLRKITLQEWASSREAYVSVDEGKPLLCLMGDVTSAALKWLAKGGIDWIWLHELLDQTGFSDSPMYPQAGSDDLLELDRKPWELDVDESEKDEDADEIPWRFGWDYDAPPDEPEEVYSFDRDSYGREWQHLRPDESE